MTINRQNGLLSGNTTVDDLIAYLKEHKSVHGNTAVVFLHDGEDAVVNFDHYKDAITIDVHEDWDDD